MEILGPKIEPRPFLKWAGGKRSLVNVISHYLDQADGAYFEPFLGAGALFLTRNPRIRKYGNDINAELINTWVEIRDDPNGLLQELALLDNSKETYLRVRELDRLSGWPKDFSKSARAARTIFLNKTCFNGLYRVNSKGEFNVPFGNYKNPRFYDPEAILVVSEFLNAEDEHGGVATLTNLDFEEAVERSQRGDIVYFDPPYAPVSKSASFVSYSPGGFNESEQIRLRDLATKLADRGVGVVLSNSDTPIVRELYSPLNGFELTELTVGRAIAAQSNSRKPAKELIITRLPT